MTTIQKRKAFASEFASFIQKIGGAPLNEQGEKFDPVDTVFTAEVADVQKLTPIVKAIESMAALEKTKPYEEQAKRVDELISDYSGKFLSCDKAFGLFSLYCSRFASKTLYKEIVLFLALYRQALNEKGWEKYNSYIEKGLQKYTEEEYCAANTAEFAPDVANNFIIDYFPGIGGEGSIVRDRTKLKFLGLEEKRLSNVILLIKHLCSWLHINKFSEGKVEMH